MKYLDRIFAAPGWLVVNIVFQFVGPEHKYHKRWFTLADWSAGRTLLCKQLDFAWWVFILYLSIIAFSIYIDRSS